MANLRKVPQRSASKTEGQEGQPRVALAALRRMRTRWAGKGHRPHSKMDGSDEIPGPDRGKSEIARSLGGLAVLPSCR